MGYIQASSSSGETAEEDGWVVCRVFKKRNLLKTLDDTKESSMADDDVTQVPHSSRDGTLNQILQYMKGSCKKEETEHHSSNYMTYLPELSNDVQVTATEVDATITQKSGNSSSPNHANQKDPALRDWATVDRLVASHLNGQSDSFKQLDFFNNSYLSLLSIPDQGLLHTHDWNNDDDLWSFTLSSSSTMDPSCHLSRPPI